MSIAAPLGTFSLHDLPGKSAAIRGQGSRIPRDCDYGFSIRDAVRSSRSGPTVTTGMVTPVIGEVVGPSDVPGLHDRLLDGTLVGRGAVDWR